MSSITIIRPGLFTTIQDIGRYGYRKFGIPISGALDKYSAGLANALVNKPLDTAIIEIILTGPVIQFNCDTLIAITGADMAPELEGNYLKMNMVAFVKKGHILSFNQIKYGAITYISFGDKILSESVFGSRSYFKGITPIHRFFAGQNILLEDNYDLGFKKPSSYIKPPIEHFSITIIKAYKGPEFDLLNKDQQQLLFQNPYKISNEYSRMGYKLEGYSILLRNAATMISSGVMPGTVQLTPSGQLIILMNDCQTTGGYPRVLQLPQRSINQLAQKKMGDQFSFEEVDEYSSI